LFFASGLLILLSMYSCRLLLSPINGIELSRASAFYDPANPADDVLWKRCADMGAGRQRPLSAAEIDELIAPTTPFSSHLSRVGLFSLSDFCSSLHIMIARERAER
jgi:hypothetical protein